MLRLVTRTATPAFLILFGIGLARTYAGRAEAKNLGTLHSRFLPKALTIYIALALTQICALIGGKSGILDTANALLFMSNGRFIDILALYCLLYAAMPLIIKLIESIGSSAAYLMVLLPWALWPYLHSSENEVYLLSFVFGLGSKVGPSLIYAISLCLFGYSLGAYSKNKSLSSLPFILSAVAILVLGFSVYELGYKFVASGIADISLRSANHPVYFAYGALGALFILGISHLISNVTKDTENAKLIFGLGANSIFSFTFGNMILNLGPNPKLPLTLGLASTVFFMVGLTLITYDVSRPKPRLFGKLTFWIQTGYRAILLQRWGRPSKGHNLPPSISNSDPANASS